MPPGTQPGYPQAPPPPPGSQYGTPAWDTAVSAGRAAGFWIRLLGIVIDLVIVFGFNLIWTFAVTLAAGGSIQGLPALLVFLVQAAIFVGYFAYLWSSRGQSIGMIATGTRVTRVDGSPLTMGRAIGRAVALLVSIVACVVPLAISAFMVALTQRKQALHDLVADTVVVHAS